MRSLNKTLNEMKEVNKVKPQLNESSDFDYEYQNDEVIEDRVKELSLMNDTVLHMNDEEAYLGDWIVFGPPDGADEDDFKDIAEDDEEYEDVCRLFKHVYKRYHKDGLYDAPQEIVEYAHKKDEEFGLKPIEHLENPHKYESLNEEDEEQNKEKENKTVDAEVIENNNEEEKLELKDEEKEIENDIENKEVEEQLTEGKSDGWSDSVKGIFEDILGKFYDLSYELDRTVRGAYTHTETVDELCDYIDMLKDELEMCVDRAREIGDEEDNLEESKTREDKKEENKPKKLMTHI